MARKLRIEFDGAWYHIVATGFQDESIFMDRSDREMMFETLGEACGRTGWQVHAWVLMDNHFHFILHTPKANLVVGMQWFMNTYTQRFNSRHKRSGRLFGDRYKSLPIETPEFAGEPEYLRSALWLVHLYPVHARLVPRSKDGEWRFEKYSWNSLLQSYSAPPNNRPPWARVEMAMGLEQVADTALGRKKFLQEATRRANEWMLEARRREGLGLDVAPKSRGWFRGGKSFRQLLMKKLEKKSAQPIRKARSKPKAKDFILQRAEELIRLGFECFEWDETAMRKAKGVEPRRLLVAEAIWKQTTISQAWIAQRLGMKSAGNVSQQLRGGTERAKGLIDSRQLRKWQKLSKVNT